MTNSSIKNILVSNNNYVTVFVLDTLLIMITMTNKRLKDII